MRRRAACVLAVCGLLVLAVAAQWWLRESLGLTPLGISHAEFVRLRSAIQTRADQARTRSCVRPVLRGAPVPGPAGEAMRRVLEPQGRLASCMGLLEARQADLAQLSFVQQAARGPYEHAWEIGVEHEPAFLAPGVQVLNVLRGFPADEAGLRPGDVIVAIDSTVIDDVGAFGETLFRAHAPQSVRLRVRRGATDLELKLERPDQPRTFRWNSNDVFPPGARMARDLASPPPDGLDDLSAQVEAHCEDLPRLVSEAISHGDACSPYRPPLERTPAGSLIPVAHALLVLARAQARRGDVVGAHWAWINAMRWLDDLSRGGVNIVVATLTAQGRSVVTAGLGPELLPMSIPTNEREAIVLAWEQLAATGPRVGEILEAERLQVELDVLVRAEGHSVPGDERPMGAREARAALLPQEHLHRTTRAACSTATSLRDCLAALERLAPADVAPAEGMAAEDGIASALLSTQRPYLLGSARQLAVSALEREAVLVALRLELTAQAGVTGWGSEVLARPTAGPQLQSHRLDLPLEAWAVADDVLRVGAPESIWAGPFASPARLPLLYLVRRRASAD